jgi:hypothetical protein
VILDPPITVDMSAGGFDCYAKMFLWETGTFIPVRNPATFPLMPGKSRAVVSNAAITYSAADASNTSFTAGYVYTNPDNVPEGTTSVKWYKNVGGTYSLIGGVSGKTITLANVDVRGMDGIRCEITAVDANWDQGNTITADLAIWTDLLQGAAVRYQTTANNSASNMVNGNLTTKWDAPTESTYTGYQGPLPHIAIFELPGGLKNISQIQVWHANSYADAQDYDRDERIATYDFDISYSSDNVNWTNEAALTWNTTQIRANKAPITVINLGSTVPARYIRITVITPNAGGEEWDTLYRSVRILQLRANTSILD